MNKVGANRAQAARLLGISERNLYRMLKRYDWSPSTQPGVSGDPST